MTFGIIELQLVVLLHSKMNTNYPVISTTLSGGLHSR